MIISHKQSFKADFEKYYVCEDLEHATVTSVYFAPRSIWKRA